MLSGALLSESSQCCHAVTKLFFWVIPSFIGIHQQGAIYQWNPRVTRCCLFKDWWPRLPNAVLCAGQRNTQSYTLSFSCSRCFISSQSRCLWPGCLVCLIYSTCEPLSHLWVLDRKSKPDSGTTGVSGNPPFKICKPWGGPALKGWPAG